MVINDFSLGRSEERKKQEKNAIWNKREDEEHVKKRCKNWVRVLVENSRRRKWKMQKNYFFLIKWNIFQSESNLRDGSCIEFMMTNIHWSWIEWKKKERKKRDEEWIQNWFRFFFYYSPSNYISRISVGLMGYTVKKNIHNWCSLECLILIETSLPINLTNTINNTTSTVVVIIVEFVMLPKPRSIVLYMLSNHR